MRHSIFALAAAFVLVTAGCLDPSSASKADSVSAPSTSVPSPLAGRWYQGGLSAIQVYDDTSGSWAPPQGTGIFFIFEPDGHYTYGGVFNNTSGGCTTKFMVQEKGTVEVAADSLRTHRTNGRSFVDNSCASDAERILEPETDSYTWSVVEEDGREVLILTWPDGASDRFYRWRE